MIQTTCKDCVFKIGNPQIGCQLNRLEKFIEQGKANIVDDHYVIDRFCNTVNYRPVTAEEARKLIQTKFCVIIDCKDTNVEDLNRTLSALKKQTLVPSVIYCVFQNSKTLPGIFKENYDDFNLLNSNFNIKMYYEEAKMEEIVKELVDKTQNRCTCLAVLQPFQTPEEDFFYKADKALNDDMQIAHIFKSYESGLKILSYSSLMAYGYDIINEEKIEGLEEFTCLI